MIHLHYLGVNIGRILISGLINIETTLHVESFPLTYEPVRFPFFGIKSTVSGVGYNVATALTTLGDKVDFLSIIGIDMAGESVRLSLTRDGINDQFILSDMPNTAQSVIIFASYKIGSAGAAEGFLTANQLENLYQVQTRNGKI